MKLECLTKPIFWKQEKLEAIIKALLQQKEEEL